MNETVEMVIKISKEDYDQIIKSCSATDNFNMLIEAYYAIKDGIVLPKGHGDLKDANDLKNECVPMRFETDSEDWLLGYPDDGLPIDMIDEVPTIIEADKEDMNEDN